LFDSTGFCDSIVLPNILFDSTGFCDSIVLRSIF
jgi:hypothetical protein